MASLFICVDDLDGDVDVDVDDHQDGSGGRERSGVADWGLEDRQLAATSHRPQPSSAPPPLSSSPKCSCVGNINFLECFNFLPANT